MASIGIEIDTSQVLAYGAHLEAAASAVPVAARHGVAKTAHDIESAMKGLVPVLTGTLRDSISSTVSGLSAEIGPDTRYAQYVEFGTSVMAPEPFAGPAFDQHASELEVELVKAAVAGLL